jgi:hypothetical protein
MAGELSSAAFSGWIPCLYIFSSAFSFAICAFCSCTMLLVLSWLAMILFLMFLARLAYCRVLCVSTESTSLGLAQAIISVRLKAEGNG